MLNTTLIKSAMRTVGLNQAALAKRCRVSKEAVSNWLSGESIPRPNKLKALSKALSLGIENLFNEADAFPEPVVAYRTRQNRRVSGASLVAAEDLARHLQDLAPFVCRKPLFVPPVLGVPSLDEEYIRDVSCQVRSRVGLSPKAPLGRDNLLKLHHEFGSLLVPVLWGGEKDGHENALSVYLPESKVSWVVFNLNAKSDDFNYWLAHELGHCYTLHALRDSEGEKFAERFAQDLLFPLEIASDALDEIKESSSPMEHANWYAGNYEISVVTVIRQADRAARLFKKEPTGLENDSFWRDWKTTRHRVPTVAEVLYGSECPSAEEYVLKSEDTFRTPVFRALAQWQHDEGGRSPAFIAAALNVGLDQAIELSHVLFKLHDVPSKSADSPNRCS